MRRASDGGGKEETAPRPGEHHGGSFGVYFAHKIQKLRQQNVDLRLSNNASGGDSNVEKTAALFAGVHVFVDGYTVPGKEELRLLVLAHGGGFEHYETSRVTHIVATRLSGSKLQQLKCVALAVAGNTITTPLD
jgi:DNA repair protein REV1